jgi:hypothetical protein
MLISGRNKVEQEYSRCVSPTVCGIFFTTIQSVSVAAVIDFHPNLSQIFTESVGLLRARELMKSRKCLEKRSAWQKIGNMLVSGDHFCPALRLH